ncbi:uncharacterized protein PHACADRAFT_214165 [Phanerochaete carnosa HHB-10118-sp]|uniref:Stealth protein CR3 conserved region 3 domain-containing protein n=1 Tax=Phanerochaete carnosa (strain HHB-10118-sp) TaxID=650164 RepID=K5VS69_PHACS|nr:uncharacterized protein PHACADRAFT_214165 [Phanerochaete carnosa HHB-10118-sp]EKM49625.1 hypothetical protein PHACADRAFT_214165 [Phanerochaete carnosa HHB-10118-sp]
MGQRLGCLLQDAKTRVQASLAKDDIRQPTSSGGRGGRQFRDHDELRYSLRSVLSNFRPYLGRYHLLTTDFAMPDTVENLTAPADYRLGQVPQWLDVDKRPWSDNHVQLSIKHHAQVFHPYDDNVFNSYAIESQFGHLDDISENFIYMNDDFFLLRRLTPRSFYTSAYGPVLRMQSDLLVAPTQYRNNVKGEWRSLASSNRLLSDRFGVRHRPYVTHEAKSASLPLLHEMSQIWEAQFAATATHPFRETRIALGNADPSVMYMLVHFTIERWREALLWSWAVAKHGTTTDRWSPEAMAAAWTELGGAPGEYGRLGVYAGRRGTVDPDRVSASLRASGHKQADGTVYDFSSLDGYPYINFSPSGGPKRNKWPRYTHDVDEKDLLQCSLDYDKCFVDAEHKPFTHASEVFKNIAFREAQCGDCITLALLKASGELGLEAFLPPSDRVVSFDAGGFAPEDIDPVAHLPLNDRWEDGEFALSDVLRGTKHANVRGWTLRLLERYRFVIGSTPGHFAMISGPSALNGMVAHLKKNPDVALLCVNDDITVDDDKVTALFKNWASDHWGTPAQWEQ